MSAGNPISSNHPFFTTSQYVAEIARPLEKLGITYFTYTRTDLDGSRVYLTNHPASLENYLTKKLYLVGNTESAPKKYQCQIVLWDTLPKQYIYDDNVRSRNIDHGMFMINPHDTYCEFFGFATRKGNDRIINTYLTKLDQLKNFTAYFMEKSASLIQEVAANKIILPFHEDKLDFIENPDVDHELKFMNASFPFNQFSISKQQAACARLLIEGKKIREIAACLHLSPRTVEHYLNHLKKKLRCSNRTQLVIQMTTLLK